MTDVLNRFPTEVPPSEADDGKNGFEAATPTLDAPARAELATAVDVGPSRAAPHAAAGAITAATWRSGQVTALWSLEEVRNAWMRVSDVGWRKLYNGRDGSFTALLILASQARQTGRTIQFREEADGMVYEIYLW